MRNTILPSGEAEQVWSVRRLSPIVGIWSMVTNF
jgi:hypothetical protein